jgi:hypothetical protein
MPSPIEPTPEADALIKDVIGDPVARARRITGIYAALYLEEPLLYQWCGLACWPANQVAMALDTPALGFGPFMAKGNLNIYRSVGTAFLRHRQGLLVQSQLQPAFELLRQADVAAHTDIVQAEHLAFQGMLDISLYEQRVVLQPLYDELGRGAGRILSHFTNFRLGWDSGAPVVDFDGSDPTDLGQREAWMKTEVLPAWVASRSARGEELRAGAERLRRQSKVRFNSPPGEVAPAR